MGVCSSNVYPTLLFDQVPAQSSALRLVSVLLTLPRQPGRDGTRTGLSPLREPQEGLSPSLPASPASKCLRKGHPGRHWGVTSHKSCPGEGEDPRDGPSQPHTQRDPHSPLSQEQRKQDTSLLSPVKPVRAAPHLPLYPIWLRYTWELLAPEWCKDPAKHCPSRRWDCQGGDTLRDKHTHMGSAGVLPHCCRSQHLEHTQTGVGRLEICIGYGDGRKGSSGATWSWLRLHPQVLQSRSVPLPSQGGSTRHQDATPKTPCQSLLP